MVGRDRRAGELQTPDWNWEQEESNMLGLVGPATEEVQSTEEQDTLYRHLSGLEFKLCMEE